MAKKAWAVRTQKHRVSYWVNLPNGETLNVVASTPNRAIDIARDFYAKHY